MELLDPRLMKALDSVATSNRDPENPNDHLRWMDGYNRCSDDPGEESLLFKLWTGTRGFEGCHRAHFLDALTKLVPDGVVKFGKHLDTISDPASQNKVLLKFQDGTCAEADAVIGCDGIKSRVREVVLGKANAAAYPSYTHKVCYRGLIPMEKAIDALGEYKAKNQHMHIGPKAHLLHFPVAGQTLMNVVAFIADPGEWPDTERMVLPATRLELEEAFAAWAPTVRSVVGLLSLNLDKWAIFDTARHPIPCYALGRICIAGDAAHAAAPHHGAGAGIGVEDALCLATLIEKAVRAIKEHNISKDRALTSAFETFNAVRWKRSQWVVQSSRRVCDIYEWTDAETGDDLKKCFEEIEWRSHKIWYFDHESMLKETAELYSNHIGAREI